MLIVDTSGIVAAVNSGDDAHPAVRAAIEQETGRLLVTDFVLAEADYLIAKYLGREAEEAFLGDVLAGGYTRETVHASDLARGLELIRRYGDHDIGITDATTVAVAERLNVRRILTLDRRHFATFKFRDSKPFILVPKSS